jgi:hypothetical protein
VFADYSFGTLDDQGDVRLLYAYPKSDPLLPVGLAGHAIVGRSQQITVH